MENLNDALYKEREVIAAKLKAIEFLIETYKEKIEPEPYDNYSNDMGKKLFGVSVQVLSTFDWGEKKPKLTIGNIYNIDKVSKKGLGIKDDAKRLRWFTVKNIEKNNFKLVK